MSNKIVCLDGFTLNPGDIDWAPFEALGDLVVHERTSPEQVVERAIDAPYVLTNKTPLPAETLRDLTGLRYVGVLATGYDVVDVEAAATRSIVVTNVPTYGTDSVAQHVMSMALNMVRPIAIHADAVRDGYWSRSPDWCFSLAPITSLAGRTLGVVGVGRIGMAVARIGAAMDMQVVGHDVNWPSPSGFEGLVVKRLNLEELFECADVVTLHCPLTEANHHLFDARMLARMKSDSLIINTSRGQLIDGAALAAALREGRIGGAALDVLENEPPRDDDPLLNAPGCTITPHIAWYARSARQRLMSMAAENLQSFIAGRRRNQVN